MNESLQRAKFGFAIPTAVLVSGSGTNLQALLDAIRQQLLPLELRLVVSNNPSAYALERARQAGIPTLVMAFDKRADDRESYAARLAEQVRKSGAELVLLLGWMHVLARTFLNAGFAGILNLHPAYLPEDPRADVVLFDNGVQTPVFRGPHALRDAIGAGVQWVGASLHSITEEVDRGPLVARRAMALRSDEDEATALQRLHLLERDVVREGILRWIAEHYQR